MSEREREEGKGQIERDLDEKGRDGWKGQRRIKNDKTKRKGENRCP